MKTVGIIGGLGPETSAKFQLEIISACLKNNKKQRPPILSWNVPVPLRAEKEIITKNGDVRKFLPLLVEAALILERAGVDFLVMPCNTMHIFVEEIRGAVNIPMLSIIDETILVIKKRKIKNVGILATSTTIKNDLFQKKLRAIEVKEVIPDKEQQKKIDKIIHNLVIGKPSLQDKIKIDQIVKDMKNNGIGNVILACTDLQLIIKERSGMKILDTMHILAEATVKKIQERKV